MAKCTKKAFRDRIAAELAASRMNMKRRSYHCNLCGKWHHTTQEQRTEKVAG